MSRDLGMIGLSQLIDPKTRDQLKGILDQIPSKVRILFFKKEGDCPTCPQQLQLLREMASLSEKLELDIRDYVVNGEEALRLRVERVPATLVVGERDSGFRYYGLTAGYEFTSLLEAIVMASTMNPALEPELEEAVKSLSSSVNLKIFVTVTCPFCPKLVRVASQFSFVNPNIRLEIIEAAEFPQLAGRYNVSGVPRTVVNESNSFDGAVPAWRLFMEILKVTDPVEYDRLKEALEGPGGSRLGRLDASHTYELMVIGGGPAAMSAALYASRKGIETAMIAKKLGGQVGYTARVDNYPGMPEAGGNDLVERFSAHLERYPIAASFGKGIEKVSREADGFLLRGEEGQEYHAKSVICCTGKEYKRLGIRGEERLIGRGIAFCATCDAPLYQGKKVAVVGGGNSALTAVRDLSSHASEIHLIHRKKEFNADRALAEEVLGLKELRLHTPYEVKEFIGDDRLTGLRIAPLDGSREENLTVDGAFLEIGLIPQTALVKELLALNRWGEIPVDRLQATTVEGFFAAGDVTDTRDKQIVVAMAQGAIAALSAHKYLLEKGLTRSSAKGREPWE